MLQFVERRAGTPEFILQWVGAGTIVGVGALGQISDTSSSSLHGLSSNLHALFGALLCAAVIARFHWGLWRRGNPAPDVVALFARHSHRTVYLMLYTLIGLRELCAIGNASAPPQAFQPYLGFGILAMVINHGLARCSLMRSA